MLFVALAATTSYRLALGFTVSRAAMQRALWLAAGAALVVTPYWLIPRRPSYRFLALIVSGTIVFLWSRCAHGIRVRAAPGAAAWAPWLICLSLLAWHGPGLFAPLEFRGDEDFHVARPLRVLEGVADLGHDHGFATSVLTAGLFAFAASQAVRRTALATSVILVPTISAALFLLRPLEPELLSRLARYPVLGAWLHVIAAFSPLHAVAAFRPALHEEALYRLVPFTSALALALVVMRVLKGPRWLRAGAAVLVATTPTLGYFATSLYPDLTAVVFVAVALLGIDTALRRRLRGRPDPPGSAPLLALGLLMKETLLPTGVAVVVAAISRAVSQRGPGGASTRLRRSVGFAFVLLAPIGLYLVFRISAQELLRGGSAFRGVGFDASAMATPAFFSILLRALLEQLGPLLPLAALGLLLFWRRSRTRLFAFVIAAQLLLFAGDGVVETAWGRLPLLWGHSRFLLTLVPPLVCLALPALSWLGRRSKTMAAAALAAGLSWNAWARPVAFDGGRSPFWGDYVAETSGERYPYDQLYAWLARAGERRPLTIVGRDYGYRDDFYLMKHGLEFSVNAPFGEVSRSSFVLAGGPDRAVLLRSHVALLERAASARGPVVLHVSAWLDVDELPREVGTLRAVRTFRLGRHALILYDRG